MNERWQSVRERLRGGVPLPSKPPEWDRVVASRVVGATAALPGRDPRARAGVVLGLLGAGAIAFGVIQARSPSTLVVATEPADGLGGWNWLVPPAYAQIAGTSTLPPIDPLQLARIRPGRWVYSRRSGVDGIVTRVADADTIRIVRDSVGGALRLFAVRIVPQRGRSHDTLMFIDNRPQARRVVTVRHSDRDSSRFATIETAIRPDTVTFRLFPPNGSPMRTHEVPASWPVGVEDVLPRLLPGVEFANRYARSLNYLDLLGGETRTAGRPYELRVVGRESVSTPAGSFDCWVLELNTVDTIFNRALRHRLKVDRESGALIQARWDEWNGFFREQELVALE